jgi:hypothetical protein
MSMTVVHLDALLVTICDVVVVALAAVALPLGVDGVVWPSSVVAACAPWKPAVLAVSLRRRLVLLGEV